MKEDSKRNWGQAFGLASCPLSFFLSTILFRNEIAEFVGILLMLLSAFWLLLEIFIGLRSPNLTKIKNPKWVALTRGLWLLGPWISWFDRVRQITNFSVSIEMQLAIVALGFFGLVCRFLTVKQLGKFFTYDVFAPNGLQLNTTGMYRWVRHPSFAGLLILTNLLGVITGSFLGILFLMMTIPNVILRIFQEEAELTQLFGSQYVRYQKNSFKLIPFIY